MNSIERRENRYRRRKAKRLEKRREHFAKFDDISKVSSMNNLNKSAKKCAKGVRWKTSTQKYEYHKLMHCTKTKKEILENKNLAKGFICFDLTERGKVRSIKATKIEERVVQKTLCREILLPALRPYLVYDNGACLKGKGADFALNRTIVQLRKYYNRYKTNKGYVLLFDIKSYFDTIPHEILIDMLSRDFTNPQIIKIITDLIMAFKKYGKVGIGLGSEISQISAVYYLNDVDHYIKDQLGYGLSNRYMDDGYIIFRTKEEANVCLRQLKVFIKKYGIKFNEKKTQIVKLERGFKFLKVRFILKPNGKVDKILNAERVTRERRKLKKYKKFVEQEIISIVDVETQISSVLGDMKRYKSYQQRVNLAILFNELFNQFGRRINYNGRIERIRINTCAAS